MDKNKQASLRPHITEKSSFLKEKGAYVFKIPSDADKMSVKKMVEETYKVAPEKVNIVNISSRKISLRGKKVAKSGFKKAVVYLKKGDKIEVA